MVKGEIDKRYAILLATIGFSFFFVVTLLIFLIPEEIHTGVIVIGTVTGMLAIIMYPWQILDVANREYILEESSVIYKEGILTRYEAEIPYSSIKGISIKRGMLQRLIGCADIRITSPGIKDPHTISSADMNSICLRSVRNFQEFGSLLRRKMKNE